MVGIVRTVRPGTATRLILSSAAMWAGTEDIARPARNPRRTDVAAVMQRPAER